MMEHFRLDDCTNDQNENGEDNRVFGQFSVMSIVSGRNVKLGNLRANSACVLKTGNFPLLA